MEMGEMTSTVAKSERDLGEGLYSLSDLRAYLSLSGVSADGAYAQDWLTGILNPVGHQKWRPDYSFGDLISLFVVRELVRKGVRSRDIRDAEKYLQVKWNTSRPFTSGDIKTDGRGVFVDDDLIAGQIEAAERHGQQVMREAISERLTSVHYDDGHAAYWTPARHILIDPRVQFGEPVIAGTRIPTGAIADMTAYASAPEIAADMGIAVDEAKAAIGFEQSLNASRN